MSGFNMVASASKVHGDGTEGKGKSDPVDKMLVMLRKKGRHVRNLVEWEEGIRACFAAKDYTRFLYDHSSIKVPADEVSRIEMQRLMNSLMSTRLKEMKKTKEAHDVIVKDEAKDDASDEQKTQKTPAKKGRKTSRQTVVEMRLRDDEHDVGRYAANIKKNAEALAVRQMKKQKAVVKRGVREVALFVNPLTSVELGDEQSNTNADILIQFDGEWKKYEAEGAELVRSRLDAWGKMISTLKELDVSVYKHVAIGDVHGLFTFVVENYHGGDRPELVQEIVRDLQGLVKGKDELFEEYVMRYEAIVYRMKQLALVFDEDVMNEHVRSSLEGAEDRVTRDVYRDMLYRFGHMKPTKLFEQMSEPMKFHEKNARMDSDLAVRQAEKARKNKEKRIRQKDKKRQQSESETSSDESSAAEEGGKLPVHRLKVDSDIAGMCLYYQEGKCYRKECKYTHEKLNEEKLGRLRRTVRERANERMKSVKCHNCGKLGHVKARCPEKKDETGSGDSREKVSPRAVRVVGRESELESKYENESGSDEGEGEESDGSRDSIFDEIGYTDNEWHKMGVRLTRMSKEQLDELEFSMYDDEVERMKGMTKEEIKTESVYTARLALWEKFGKQGPKPVFGEK